MQINEYIRSGDDLPHGRHIRMFLRDVPAGVTVWLEASISVDFPEPHGPTTPITGRVLGGSSILFVIAYEAVELLGPSEHYQCIAGVNGT